ncbi:coiled-coil and C2 domain-containing protein 1-like isoform X5 [Harmonia axyridis]|uniref:coiled-coil and C2 domain-containing protein 1-like isoform X5 n=1 Tax=Harmonia axyridis TaxID=115357 RepID=UPI001E278E39|nr:coiled-coil and C2 domain-containing protein 1-like isoform X5 [Harmonia axyridis]
MKRGGGKKPNGLFNIDFDTGVNADIDENDSDLEAELMALAGNNAVKRPQRKKPIPQKNFDAMVAESMKDVPSDDDISVDENDPDLLSELNEIVGEDEVEDSSPPEVEPPSAESPPSADLELLEKRFEMYEAAEKHAKETGETSKARRYARGKNTVKDMIKQVKSGKPININDIPPEVKISKAQPAESEATPKEPNIMEIEHAEALPTPSSPEKISPEKEMDTSLPSVDENLLSLLKQRHMQYKMAALKAKKSNDVQSAVSYLKTAKQFEHVMEAVQNGQAVDISQMPGPPEVESPKVEEKMQQSTEVHGNQIPNSRADQQMQILLLRQKQFKQAALKAKNKGELTQAKEFLRTAKGFDKLIEAASCGLPVDFSTLPLPPDEKSQLDKDKSQILIRFDMVSADDCLDDDPSSTDILTRLEHQLQKQLKMCLTTRDHNKTLGDVAGTNRFERLALNVTKDLDVIRLAKKTPGAGVPKFHYENKDFSVVKSFTELTDNELEIAILRGINYNTETPKDIDTYVKFSFPWPQESPFTEKTATIKDTNNPEYDATFMVPINRTQRSCQRAFKRHAVKFEVYSKGCCLGASDFCCCFSGWFRSDTLLGTVTVKLQNLETQCELHESYDLMDGRKKTGGKLEVRMRLRHPIVTQEVEQIHEKWLVIGS